MKKRFYQLGKQVLSLSVVIASTLLFSNQVSAQGVSINATGTGTAPAASSILDLDVSGLPNNGKKGFLVPRITAAQKALIASPATGLLIYQTDATAGFYYYDGVAWVTFGGGSGPTAGFDTDISSGTNVDIEPDLDYVKQITAPFLQDLTLQTQGSNIIFRTTAGPAELGRFLPNGNFGIGDPNPSALFTVGNGDKFQVDANGNLIEINDLGGYSWPTGHASGVLRNNGTGTLTWGAPTISGVAPLTTNNIWIGVGNIATERTMSGDATLTDNGTNAVLDLTALAVETSEINTNAVTDAKIRQSAGLSVIGRSANSTGDVADITAGTDGHVLRRNGTALGFGTIGGASFGPQTANTVFAGPTTGVAANPTFRGIEPADLAASGASGEVLGITGSVLDWVATMTNPMIEIGDMIYGSTNATPSTPVRLDAGATGTSLQINGSGIPSWSEVDLTNDAEVTGTTGNHILLGTSSGDVAELTGGATNYTVYHNGTTWVTNASAASGLLTNGTRVGINQAPAGAYLTIGEPGDNDHDNTNFSLQLDGGDIQGEYNAIQIALGQYDGLSRHAIRTRHNTTGDVGNAIEFYIWKLADGTGTVAPGSSANVQFGIDNSGIAFKGSLTANGSPGTNGQVLKSGGTGANATWVDVSTLGVTNIATGTGLTGGPITGTGTISVANDGITTTQILNGTITGADLAAGAITADNGLNISSANNVRLGGSLAVATTITHGNLDLTHSLSGTGDFIVQTSATNKFIFDATTGNVGIGNITAPSHKLQIDGKVKSTGINETSDVRLKTNFSNIDGALNKVLSMNGKYYDWRTTEFPNKGFEIGRQVGVIAQEIEEILPEVVDTDNEGYKSVEYSHIVPVLIEAIKEQQRIIDGQNSTITDLKASLENVLIRVNIIEKNADINTSKVEK